MRPTRWVPGKRLLTFPDPKTVASIIHYGNILGFV